MRWSWVKWGHSEYSDQVTWPRLTWRHDTWHDSLLWHTVTLLSPLCAIRALLCLTLQSASVMPGIRYNKDGCSAEQWLDVKIRNEFYQFHFLTPSDMDHIRWVWGKGGKDGDSVVTASEAHTERAGGWAECRASGSWLRSEWMWMWTFRTEIRLLCDHTSRQSDKEIQNSEAIKARS